MERWGAYIGEGRGPRGGTGTGTGEVGPGSRGRVKPGEWARRSTVGRQLASFSGRGELDGWMCGSLSLRLAAGQRKKERKKKVGWCSSFVVTGDNGWKVLGILICFVLCFPYLGSLFLSGLVITLCNE